MTDFMQSDGLAVFRNGYPLIPIVPREKRPALDGWRNITATEALVKSWRGGIGIRTGFVVFIDIDVPNVAADRVKAICERIVGPAPVRVGNAPKLGLMYRSETVFKTRISTGYTDEADKRCAIEALADGRQFVAYGIHPITGNPYYWVTAAEPTNTRVEDLTLITEAQIEELFTAFDTVAFEEGWALSATPAPLRADGEGEVPFGTKSTPVPNLSDDKIAEYVRKIPNDTRFDAREAWLKFGMAIHHQTDGSPEGRELFLEWSEQHPSHSEAGFDKAWNSFGNGYNKIDNQPITFRYIIKLAGDIRRAEQAAELARIDGALESATTFDAITKLAFDISALDGIDEVRREIYATRLQAATKRLGTKLGIVAIRKMLRPPPGDAEMPKWLENWVFLKETDQFYDTETCEYVGPNPFNRAFGRWVKDDTAAHFATDVAKIPIHHMTAYLPGEPRVWVDPLELSWVNTYRDTSPGIPAQYSARDLAAIERVKAHANHLFGPGMERDIAILHSALAHIVQTGKRINWLLLIQGAEAIGKTFYAHLLRAVLGERHVHELTTDTLTESSFTAWAEGHQVVYIEELKLHGKRYDVLNKMKSYISNEYVSVHPKYRTPYNIKNVTSYFAFTNHRDALPIEQGDTRYFFMLSQWQNGDDVVRFKEENPDYYRALWATLDQSAGALRRWLLEYDLHPEFSPVDRAPASLGKQIVLRESKPEIQQQVEDLIADGLYPGISRELMVSHLLREALADEYGMLPEPEAVRAILRRMQFTPISVGRIKITDNKQNKYYYCWSQNPRIIRVSLSKLRELIGAEFASRL